MKVEFVKVKKKKVPRPKYLKGVPVKEYFQQYYKDHKPGYIHRSKKYVEDKKQKKFEQQLRVLYWIYNELDKVAEYERNFPYIPPIKIPRVYHRKPHIKSKVKKEFNYRSYMKKWIKTHQDRAKPDADVYVQHRGYINRKEKKDGKE